MVDWVCREGSIEEDVRLGGGGGELVLGLADEVVAACKMREDPADLDSRAADLGERLEMAGEVMASLGGGGLHGEKRRAV